MKNILSILAASAAFVAMPAAACQVDGQGNARVGAMMGDASANGSASMKVLREKFWKQASMKDVTAAGCTRSDVDRLLDELNPDEMIPYSGLFKYPLLTTVGAKGAAQPTPVAAPSSDPAPVAAPSATPSPVASAASEAVASAAAPKPAPVVAAPLAVKPLPARINISEIWVALNALKTTDAEIRNKIAQKSPDQLTPEQLTLLNQLNAIPDIEARLRNLPVNGEVETSTLPAPQQAAVQQVIAAQSLAEEYLGRETLDGMTVAYAPFMLFFLIVSIFGIRAYRNRKTEIASAVETALQVDGLSHTMLAARLGAVEDSVKNIGEQTGATDKVDLGQTQLQALSALPVGDEIDVDVYVNSESVAVLRFKRNTDDQLVIVTRGIIDYTDGTPIARPEAFVRKAYKDGRLRLVLSTLVLTQQAG